MLCKVSICSSPDAFGQGTFSLLMMGGLRPPEKSSSLVVLRGGFNPFSNGFENSPGCGEIPAVKTTWLMNFAGMLIGCFRKRAVKDRHLEGVCHISLWEVFY